MRHTARQKRRQSGGSIREQAAGGWVCLLYDRLNINVMTPVQRTYYDIEGTWRDDYQKIPLDVMLREDGFGDMRLTRELGDGEEDDDEEVGDDEEELGSDDVDDELDYEEDED